GARPVPARTLVLAGEPLRARPPAPRVVNEYGLAEAAGAGAWHEVAAGESVAGAVPVGRPAAGTRALVLDARLQPVPAGVTGELYLAGATLARGYLGRPDATAASFVADPHGDPGSRMCRTGDLARWREDGVLELRGRAADLVRLEGRPVVPADVEAALAGHPDVAAAVVAARGGRLVAHAAAAGPPLDGAALRRFLAERLPEHLVPEAVVVVERLPLTAEDRVDRAALPAPTPSDDIARPTRTERERALCGLFAEVLGVPAVGPDDGFFELGGHSLLAMRLVALVRERLGAPCSVRSLFAAQTPAALADRLDAGAEAGAEALLHLRRGGLPLFCVHPAGGLAWVYAGLLPWLPAELAVYGIQARGLVTGEALPASVDEMAADYAERIEAERPDGSCALLGWSFGGLVAHATAARLQERGRRVSALVLLDAYPVPLPGVAESDGEDVEERLLAHFASGSPARAVSPELVAGMARVHAHAGRLRPAHHPPRLRGGALLVRAVRSGGDPAVWTPYVDGLTVRDVDCEHGELLAPDRVEQVGRLVAPALSAAATAAR
ncbi:MAG TPA: thioesterase domain-containing protein, partial [Candidatus Dormibacteraeota bacterium]|nr:thioesterase domain-containing protein [Candidatus Dormibacteraeota bacterium]